MTAPEAALWIDPARRFGKVCVHGTRVSALAVAESVWVGEDPVTDYGITERQALVACWWVAIHESRRWRKRWGAWAGDAFPLLWSGDELPPWPPTMSSEEMTA